MSMSIFFIFLAGWIQPAEVPAHDPIPSVFREALKPGEHFPLSPGWRWTYRREGKDVLFLETFPGRKFGDVETTRLRALGEGFCFAWGRNSFVALRKGILLCYGSLSRGLWETHLHDYNPPQILLPAEFREESLWDSSSRAGKGTYSLRFQGIILCQDSVQVPAGRFRAWKIDYNILDPYFTSYNLRAWYTPGIGFVKIIQWRESRESFVYDLSRIEAIADAHPIDFPSEPIPVEKLPERVAAPPGRVTLHADYGDRWQGGVVVYLVNRTARIVGYPLNGGDALPLWLETRMDNGEWRLAKRPPHCQLDAPTSLPVGPGKFIRLLGPATEKGEERDVRYRMKELRLVSNAGKGLVDPGEAHLARYDIASIEEAGAALVREVLFKEIDLPEKELNEARENAIYRLRKLPPQEALPILVKLKKSDVLLRGHFLDFARVYAELSPHNFRIWSRGIISHGPSRFRRQLLDLLGIEGDEELQSILLKQLEDSRHPDLRFILSSLSTLGLPGVKERLMEIAGDEEQSRELRIAAEFELARGYGTELLDLVLVRVYHDYPNFSPSFPIVVKLKNKSPGTIEFGYDRPTEILALYLEERTDDSTIRRFLEPRPGVAWFQKPGGEGERRVRLPPGASHEIRLRLLDYFELSFGSNPNIYFTIYPVCFLPGYHDVPQLGVGAWYRPEP